MIFLRLYLLTGLVVHKLAWEVLKRKQARSEPGNGDVSRPKAHRSYVVQLVKAVKIAILLGVAAQTLLPEILPISAEPLVLRIAGTLIYTAGLLIAIRGRTELGTNWSDIENSKILREHTVISNGPYRFIRHPIYVGDLLLLFGLELALNSWLVLGLVFLTPLVLRQAIHEERKLVSALPGYRAYCAQTKRFIPFVV